MIALLTGNIAYRSIDHIILDVGGVGYRIQIPLSTFYSLPEEGQTRLFIHTHVKEDALQLFGFLTPAEKEMFCLLLTVSGVGPKLALNILSNIPAPELLGCLVQGNSTRLCQLPGIGKKTAERLVLELRDKAQKMGLIISSGAPQSGAAAPSVNEGLDEALSALVNLGYKEVQARKALQSMELPPNATVETILKGALKVLVR